MKFGAIITAGGISSRYGKNKLLEKINEKTVIEYTVSAFLESNIDEIVICGGEYLKEIFSPSIKIVQGGQTRQESVYNGLQTLDCDYVLIHDGARPMVTKELIQRVKDSVVDKKAVTVMTKTTDTIKEIDETGKIIKTIDRTKLYNTQTPQAFEYSLIKSVHEKLKNSEKEYTDDCSMLEELGYDVYKIDGDYKNIKITVPTDIDIAKIYFN